MSVRKPPPVLLGCGHFATVERDGQPACLICAEKATAERVRAQVVTVHETGPDPTPATVATTAVDAPAIGETEPVAGVYNIPDSIYHADVLKAYGTESLSATSHRYLVAPFTPAHYRYRIDHQGTGRTPAMIFGSAFHAVSLETADLDPFDGASWNSKAGQQFLADHPDHGERLPILAKDVSAVKAMAHALQQHPIARRALTNGQPEQALIAQHPDLGVWLRCKVDYLANAVGSRLIVTDLKSTECAHESEFATSAGKYCYDLQADNTAFLARALRLAKQITMIFVAVESSPPYLVNVHEIAGDDLKQARALNEAAEQVFARCLETGDWPGFPVRVNKVSMPAWIARNRENALLDMLEGDPE